MRKIYYSILMLAFISASVICGQEPLKIMANGGFELGTVSWQNWNENSAFTLVNDPVQTGESAVRIFMDGQAVHGILQDLTDSMRHAADGSYYSVNLKASIYKPAAFDGNIELDVAYWDASGKHNVWLDKVEAGHASDTWITRVNTWPVIKIDGALDSAIFETYTWGGSGTTPYYADDFGFELKKILPAATPSNLAATAFDESSVTLEWVNNEAAYLDGFIVLVDGDSTMQVNEAKAIVGGLTKGTDYEFGVVAYNMAGYSDTVYIVAGSLKDIPADPADLVVEEATLSAAFISWADNSDNEAGFILYVDGVAKDTVAANVTEGLVKGLLPMTEYQIDVYAYNNGGMSANPATGRATTNESSDMVYNGGFEMGEDGWYGWDASDADSDFDVVSIPVQTRDSAMSIFKEGSAVLGIKQDITKKFNTLADGKYYDLVLRMSIWKPAAFDGNIEMLVRYFTNGEEKRIWLEKITADMASDEWLARSNPWTTLHLVEEVDSAFVENYSWGGTGTSPWFVDNVSLKASLFLPPSIPVNLTASNITHRWVTLSWENEDEDAPDGYIITRNGDSVMSVVNSPTSVIGLEHSTSYEFGVVAFSVSGLSDTAKITVTTLIDPDLLPAAPSGLSAVAESESEISLSWTDESDNEEGFYVQMKVDGEWVNQQTLAADVTAASVTGLTAATAYTFRVSAFSALGELSSAEVTASTLSVGLDENSHPGLRIMPNPASDVLHILSDQQLEWSMYSITGSLVKRGIDKEIEVSSLHSGTYFLKINQAETGLSLLKFIKQ